MSTDKLVQYITDIIVTLGGTSAIIVVIAKFMKSRFEKFFDAQIERKSNEALKLFESNLEKKKVYYEKKVAKELESIDTLVEFYTKSFPLVNVMQSAINEMITNNTPTSSIASISESVRILQDLVSNAKQNHVIPEIYLDRGTFNSYNLLLNNTEKCIALFYEGINTYDLSPEKRQVLSVVMKETSEKYEDNIKQISRSIHNKAK